MTTRPFDHGWEAIQSRRSQASSGNAGSQGSKMPSEWQIPRQSTDIVATPHSLARSGYHGLSLAVAL